MFCGILFSCRKEAPKVLIYIKEESPQLEYMLTNEVGKMIEVLKGAGFDVTIASMSGEVLKAGSVTFKPDLMFGKVSIDDYAGFIFPCMVSDMASSTVVTFARETVNKGKPIAAQAGGVVILAKAGVLNGKKYALVSDQSNDPDFKGGIYSGTGVVQDGIIITSGVCPWIAKDPGFQDGTTKLCQVLIDIIKTRTK
jgi:putative intracellular protease/amidase